MAYRNRVRSWLAVSVLALTAATPLLGPPAAVAMTGCDGSTAPPATPQNVEFIVTVRDDGFSQQTINARVGDLVTFRLDDAAVKPHTLDWDQGPAIYRYPFDRDHGKLCRTYGPLRQQDGGGVATLHFYDAEQVPGYRAGGPFTGTLTVSDGSAPPPSSTSSTSTTVTTAPPSTATTTTTAPTTTTSEPSSVQPFLIPDSGPTTTTTAGANPLNVGAGPTKNGGTTATTANKDKGKAKAAATETSATTAPAPPAMPPDSVFDAGVLTPSPTTLPEPAAASDPGAEASLNASSVLDLLDPEKPAADDGDTRLLLIGAVGALGLLVAIGVCLWWGHRATRWDPA